jgi:hypothetical protein
MTATDEMFDVEAAAEQLKQYQVEIENYKAGQIASTRKAAKLLLNVAQNHSKDLDKVCDLAGIGRSRRMELLAIARGRKTEQQTRDDTNNRSKKRRDAERAKKKHHDSKRAKKPAELQRPEVSPLHPPATDTGGAGAAPLKPPLSTPNEAMANFRYACEAWLPKMPPVAKPAALRFALQVCKITPFEFATALLQEPDVTQEAAE